MYHCTGSSQPHNPHIVKDPHKMHIHLNAHSMEYILLHSRNSLLGNQYIHYLCIENNHQMFLSTSDKYHCPDSSLMYIMCMLCHLSSANIRSWMMSICGRGYFINSNHSCRLSIRYGCQHYKPNNHHHHIHNIVHYSNSSHPHIPDIQTNHIKYNLYM
jgi:hypothetical protein